MNEMTPIPRPLGKGFLVVQVTTANTAIPLSGATVIISRDEPESADVLYQLRSGGDGRTERVELSAPPRIDSQRPSSEPPYTAYNIEVRMPQYQTALYRAVPIFDGITSMQQANLVPLPENGFPDDFTLQGPRIYDEREPGRVEGG